MIEEDIDFKKCNGCGACFNVCPKKCISMISNKEGFLYPHVNRQECIHCELCTKICPLLMDSTKIIQTHDLTCYSGYYKNVGIMNSTSGGIAQALYRYMINKGGIGYGVKYSENFLKAQYERISKLEEIEGIIGSKYIQAEKGGIYLKVISDLKNNKYVLFIGTPCEVAAIKNMCRNIDSKLIAVELVCHGVTSPLVHEKYIDDHNKENKQIKGFSVRYKKEKWLPKFLKCDFKNGDDLCEKFDDSDYGIAFSTFSRMSCYDCKFKGDNRVGDITIGDFWGVDKKSSLYNEKGTSVVFIHTQKGLDFIKDISEVEFNKISYDYAIKGNPYINTSHIMPSNRMKFSENIQKYTLKKTITKSFPFVIRNKKFLPVKVRVLIKKIMRKLNIH